MANTAKLVTLDEAKDFAKMQALIPNCFAREVAHSDHNVHLGNKEDFYRYFDEFLKRI